MTRPKLTDQQWRTIFELRCRAKRGEHIRDDEWRLLEAAFREDPMRYGGMSQGVNEKTKPFGAR